MSMRKHRADGTLVPRGVRPAPAPPPPEALEALETFTDGLPEEIRAFREYALIGPERRYRLEQAIDARTRSLVVVLHDVHDPHNQAAVMRTCEAMGVQEVHVVKMKHAPLRPSERITQHADRWLDVVAHDSPVEAIEHLRRRGLRVLATALRDDTPSLSEVDFTAPTAVLLGNESRGLPEEVIDACDGTLQIPLCGLSQSLNVSVAAAVVVSTAVAARRAAWGQPGDLGEAERASLRRRFYRVAAGDTRIPSKLRAKLDSLE